MSHFQHILKGIVSQSSGNPLLPFLVAGYKLNGNAHDVLGINNGTTTNVSWVNDDERGLVAVFNGNGFIDTTFERHDGVGLFCTATETFSLTVWAKVGLNIDGTLIARGTTNVLSRTFHLLFQGSVLRASTPGIVNRGSGIIGTNQNSDDNTWHNHAVVWDGSLLKYYLDGVFVMNLPAGAAAEETGQRIILGARTNGTGFLLTGSLSDTYIFKKALTVQEINLAMQGL